MAEMKKDLVVGVLALQGGFSKHLDMLRSLGVKAIEVRRPEELALCDGLVLPGGESTVIMKQLDFSQLRQPLTLFSKNKPLFGTCAGLIVISQEILQSPLQSPMVPFGLLDVSVERNAFGRQIESFAAAIEVSSEISSKRSVSAIFIRAPRIKRCGVDVQVLAAYEGEPVLVQQGFHLGATFHPELTVDNSIHAYYLELVKRQRKN